MKAYLDAKRREPDVGKFADFHLLLYLAELLDVEVSIVHVCKLCALHTLIFLAVLQTALAAAQSVKEKRPIPEGLLVILQSILE